MAHYAFINKDNIVVEVITGVDENITQKDLDGTIVGGSTEAWELFYASKKEGLYCKRTSYNGNFRKNYASIGSTYDEQRDAFITPKPSDVPEGKWILNENTCKWELIKE